MRPVAILMIMAGIASANPLDQPWDLGTCQDTLPTNGKYADDISECGGTINTVEVWAYTYYPPPGSLTVGLWTDEDSKPGDSLQGQYFHDPDWKMNPYGIYSATVTLTTPFVLDWANTYWVSLRVQNGGLLEGPPLEEWGEECCEYICGQWDQAPDGNIFMVVGGTLGLEANTWGAIKALW